MILELTFVFALTGHAIDTATTQRCIGAGTCTESNKILGRFKDPIGFAAVKTSIAGISEIGIYRLSRNHKKLAIITNLAIGAVFTGIGIRNYRLTK